MCDNNVDSLPPPLGPRIRELRLARGWSLAELARRMHSSPAAIHRYENGWEQFEIPTLRRLAAALGVRLDVRLVPGAEPPGPVILARSPKAAPRPIARAIAPLFWDHPLCPEDYVRYPAWICARVLMLGNHHQARAVRRWFGDGLLRQAIRRREVDERTRRFWHLILEDDLTAADRGEG